MQKAHPESQDMNAMPPQAMEMDNAMPPAQEVANDNIPESIKQPKESALKSIGVARSTILGSGSILDETKKLGISYKEFITKSVSSNLKTVGKLVTLHPVEAVKEFVSGATGNLKHAVDIVTSPFRFAYAGVATTADLAKKTVKLPFKAVSWVAKSPFKVGKIISNGTQELFNIANKINTWNKGH